MDKNSLLVALRSAILAVPDVVPLLQGRARWLALEAGEYKTFDYMLKQIEGLVRGVYDNNLGGSFIDIMANLISGQLTQAYRQALEDQGFTDFILPEYLQVSLDAMILGQYDFVDQYYRDIIDARVDGTSIAPLLARAQLWAQRWVEAYNEAVRLITIQSGGNLMWKLGDTEEHCPVCAGLDGIVAWAREWAELNVRPQSAPNSKLTCGGWRCDCSLLPTDRRRSPNAYGRIEEILLSR